MYLYIHITIQRYLRSQFDGAYFAYSCNGRAHFAYSNLERMRKRLVTTITTNLKESSFESRGLTFLFFVCASSVRCIWVRP